MARRPYLAISALAFSFFCAPSMLLWAPQATCWLVTMALASDPLADGRVPAALSEPHEHWQTIFAWPSPGFVPQMTKHRGWWKRVLRATRAPILDRLLADEVMQDGNDTILVNYGGDDGHQHEGAWYESRPTRCSTTQAALVSYFCGAEAANRSTYFGGPGAAALDDFEEVLAALRGHGEKERRYVFRLDVVSESGRPGFSHAWTVVLQPNGTLYWLQSFVGQYTLQEWMSSRKGGRYASDGPALHIRAFLEKLRRLRTLFNISSWGDAHNTAYHDLFWVDQRAQEGFYKFNMSDMSLGQFRWNLACRYPTPNSAQARGDAILGDSTTEGAYKDTPKGGYTDHGSGGLTNGSAVLPRITWVGGLAALALVLIAVAGRIRQVLGRTKPVQLDASALRTARLSRLDAMGARQASSPARVRPGHSPAGDGEPAVGMGTRWAELPNLGLEVQQPWAQMLLSGQKTVETRAYPLPAALIGRPLYVVESGSGVARKSSLPDQVPAGHASLRICGTATFKASDEYPSRAAWLADEAEHCVPADSPYAMQDDHTNPVYAWRVEAVVALETPLPVPAMRRVMRSLFELTEAVPAC